MTNRQLLEKLQGLTEEQLDMDVTLYALHMDEYYPVEEFYINEGDDVLDDQHPYLTF